MTSPRAVLIVDADPKGLESLVYGFQGAEWRMTACPTPETASLLVKASGANIVVVASRTEHEKMHSLVRQLRAKEATRAMPILVLGPEDQRPLLEQAGDVDLLPLPAFVRDVLTASELLVGTRSTMGQKQEAEPCFHASISSVHTLSLVRTMNGLCRSGQLRLERNGRAGEILFHQGELTSASIGALQAMTAAQHLMVWNDGKLELRLRPVPHRGQLHLSAQDFLLELDRFQRDYAHAMKAIGPATTVFATNPERLKQAGNSVPAEVTPVVRLCDGRRALCDILDESPFRVLDTVRILGRLAELGVLTHADGKLVTSKYTPAPPSDSFLDTAKITGSWPMPAPIGGFPTSEPPKAPPASTNPATETKEAGRPRRQTLELGIPPAQTFPPAKTPAPVLVAKTPGPTPRPAPLAQAASQVMGQVPATIEPAQAVPALATPGPVTPPPVTPPPVTPPPAATTPVAPAGVIVVGKPASPAQPGSPIATMMQASGAAGGKPVSSSLASKLVPTTARASAVMAAQTGAQSPGPTTTLMQASGAMATSAPVQASAPTSPAAAPTTASGTLVAGVIESRKDPRRTQQTMRAVTDHPSVIVESLDAESVKTPLPSTAPAAGSPRQQIPSPSPDAAATAAAPARITGVLQIAPSRKAVAQTTPPARASIQVDVSLSDPISNTPTRPIASAPVVARVTGEMNVAPSGRTTRSMGKATPPSSFHINPSLTGKAQGKTPGPTRTTPAPRRSDSQPIPPSGTPSPRRRDSQPIPGTKRHATGGFSPVESDFFEREADLYKEEKPESFADLDAGKAKSAKARPGGKPGRPYRK